MLTSSLIAFLHFAFAFVLVACVAVEWFTFGRTPTHAEASRIARADRWYGVSAAGILVVGFLRVFYFEKGSDFYFKSPFFHLKLTLFVVMGLLSIYPTVRFMRWGADLRAGRAPLVTEPQYRSISRSLSAQLVLAIGIVAAASLMAHGAGR